MLFASMAYNFRYRCQTASLPAFQGDPGETARPARQAVPVPPRGWYAGETDSGAFRI